MLEMLIHNLRDNDFTTYAPNLCLLHGQFAQLLGRSTSATRYYRACQRLINPDSEMSLVAQASLLATSSSDKTAELAQRCLDSSNASILFAGHFFASVVEKKRSEAKFVPLQIDANGRRRIVSAYEICQKSNSNLFRLLIFAYTTSVHIYGSEVNTLRQLETGRDISALLGGKGRTDGVGQAAFGIWFNQRLRGE